MKNPGVEVACQIKGFLSIHGLGEQVYMELGSGNPRGQPGIDTELIMFQAWFDYTTKFQRNHVR